MLTEFKTSEVNMSPHAEMSHLPYYPLILC